MDENEIKKIIVSVAIGGIAMSGLMTIIKPSAADKQVLEQQIKLELTSEEIVISYDPLKMARLAPFYAVFPAVLAAKQIPQIIREVIAEKDQRTVTFKEETYAE